MIHCSFHNYDLYVGPSNLRWGNKPTSVIYSFTCSPPGYIRECSEQKGGSLLICQIRNSTQKWPSEPLSPPWYPNQPQPQVTFLDYRDIRWVYTGDLVLKRDPKPGGKPQWGVGCPKGSLQELGVGGGSWSTSRTTWPPGGCPSANAGAAADDGSREYSTEITI